MSSAPDVQTSNHDKYVKGANNPVVAALLKRLFGRVRDQLAPLNATSLLDAGCGEGHDLHHLREVLPARFAGVDLNPDSVAHARHLHPEGEFAVESIYELPFDDGSFDVVLCMEVLEHLDRPADALAELSRVAARHVVLSVPFEPWFQLGNLARGKYLEGWGNHPEHIQHWNLGSFRRFVEANPRLRDVVVVEAWPWIVARAAVVPAAPPAGS